MKRIIKIWTGIMAFVLCFVTMFGTSVVPVQAATQTSTAYMCTYPMAGDAYEARSEELWGHSAKTFMNGWTRFAFTGYTVHCQDSYRGKVNYCIEPGVVRKLGDTYTQMGEDFWENYPEGYNNTIKPDTIKLLIGRVMQYGYQGNISPDWLSQNADDADKLGHIMATQVLVWEIVVGERDAYFNHVDTGGKDEVKSIITKKNPCYSRFVYHYNSIVASMKSHTVIPSFMARSTAASKDFEFSWNGKEYTTTLTDTNGVLSKFNFSSNTSGVTFSKNGNQLTISTKEAPKSDITITATRPQKKAGIIVWSDGLFGPDVGVQDTVTYNGTADDPIKAYMKVGVSYGDVEIVKTSEDGKIAGVRFHISGIGVNYTAVTNLNGELVVSRLVPGVYTITELTEDRYEPQEVRKVTVVAGQTSTVDFNNVLKRGDLTVIKQAEDGFKEGVKFHLYGTASSGHWVSAYAVTDKNGVATFEDILIGTEYTLEEVDTGIRYVVPEKQSAAVEWNTVTNKSFTNVLKKFCVTVTKTDKETGNAQGDASLEGARYGIYKGVKLIDTYITDENGEFTTSYYPCGDDWSIRELKPSKGYLLDDTSYPVGADAKTYTVEYNHAGPLNVFEQVIKGQIAITKKADNGEEKPESPEEDATFEVYLKSAGSFEMAKKTERDILICDENGYADTKSLPYGVYTVHQTYGWDGRELVEDFEVLITEDGQVYEYVLTNKLVYGEVRGIKIDENGEGLAGATIGIFYPGAEEPFATAVSAEDGRFSFANVYYGEYVIREVASPEGYLMDKTSYPVSIDEKGAIVEIEITNILIRGNVQLTKVDADYPENKLTGAKFEIYQNGELIGTMEELENGVYQMMDLPYGEYTLKEVAEPEGFCLDTNTYEFAIKEDGITVVVEHEAGKGFVNQAQTGSIRIEKTSEDGVLEGFRFKVEGTDVTGHAFIAEYVTDEKGMIFIEGLRVGDYVISEIADENNERYKLPADVTVTVHKDKTVVAEFYNKLETEIPNMGDDNRIHMIECMMAVSICLIALAIIKRRKNTGEKKNDK